MTKAQKAEQAEAVERLREILKPGDTVYTILRHVSKSGMLRHVSPVKMTDDGPWYLTYWVAKAAGYKTASGASYAVKMTGCGMDMGFALVYALSRVLEENAPDGSGWTPEDVEKAVPGTPHSGYALNHRWL
jgi:hypothetical protein